VHCILAAPREGAPVTTAIEAVGLGKRYGRRWALQDCSVTIPSGRVVGLVGANAAGKSTLMHLLVGLLAPTTGRVSVLGHAPAEDPAQLARVGFLAQDAPLYSTFSIGDHLRMCRALNGRWDDATAKDRIEGLALDPRQRAGQLSGGQRAQVALTMAVEKRPELLLLDEPVAGLDPLARREFLEQLMESVAAHQLTVVLSSHLLNDIQRVCDYLIVLAASRVQMTGAVPDLLAAHRVLTGPRDAPAPPGVEVIEARRTAGEATLVVRTTSPVTDPAWRVSELDVEDLVLAYLSQGAAAARPGSSR
jgi:ABC-2 type transport system ATP-binding protein